MHRIRLICLAAFAAVPALSLADDAMGLLHSGGVCPQCQCQEQIVYKDCITHRCRLVPEKKPIKKTVYEVKEVPYCLPKLPPFCSLFHHKSCCDQCCVECDCPRYKRVLIKKEITCGEICTMKCEVEEIVTRVPCRVCTSGCPNCTQPTAPAEAPGLTPVPDAGNAPAVPAPLPAPEVEPLSLGSYPPPVIVAK